MVHTLAVNSVSSLLAAFSAQLQTTPSVGAIMGWTSVLDEIPDGLQPDLDAVSAWTGNAGQRRTKFSVGLENFADRIRKNWPRI